MVVYSGKALHSNTDKFSEKRITGDDKGIFKIYHGINLLNTCILGSFYEKGISEWIAESFTANVTVLLSYGWPPSPPVERKKRKIWHEQYMYNPPPTPQALLWWAPQQLSWSHPPRFLQHPQHTSHPLMARKKRNCENGDGQYDKKMVIFNQIHI